MKYLNPQLVTILKYIQDFKQKTKNWFLIFLLYYDFKVTWDAIVYTSEFCKITLILSSKSVFLIPYMYIYNFKNFVI